MTHLWTVTVAAACRASVVPALAHHVVNVGEPTGQNPFVKGFELALPGHESH